MKGKIKILHIGNIANNAYLNSKILNSTDKYECDVLVCDYYHIMGCPEWEDSKLTENVDEFYPNWNKSKLRGFKRPKWFSNGPRYFAIKYLEYKDNTFKNKFFRKICEIFSIIISYKLFRKPVEIFVRIISLLLSFEIKNIKSEGPELERVFEKYKIDFSKQFPDRADEIKLADRLFYNYKQLNLYKTLLKKYDLIHCYGTDPIWPYLANIKKYISYEHATIRKIPFDDTVLGRLVAISYSRSSHTIITNCDSNKYAKKLKCKSYSFVPHPVNEKCINYNYGKVLRNRLEKELKSNFILFHPPRQHWEPWKYLIKQKKYYIDPAWYKGNDIFYEGFKIFLDKTNANASIICVNWGKSVDESKKLIAKLNIQDKVKWVEPKSCFKMNEYVKACDILVDQFWVGAFGSTLPKAFQLSIPGMCYVNANDHKWCLKEMPPILNAKNVEEVSKLLIKSFNNRKWLAQIGKDGKKWYDKYHSNKVILKKLNKIYNNITNNFN